MSASLNSVSLSTRVASHSLARSAVMFWLQAMMFMSKAAPTLATKDPMWPNPISPKVLPLSPTPTVVPQVPSLDRCSSSWIWRSIEMIKPQVSSVGPSPEPGAPQTGMPNSVAASMSKEALRRPVVISNFNFGSWERMERVKGVRSRMPITMSKSLSRSTSLASSTMWS